MFRIVFWDILPCKMIVERRFRGAYCLHHQGWWFYTAVYPRRQFWTEFTVDAQKRLHSKKTRSQIPRHTRKLWASSHWFEHRCCLLASKTSVLGHIFERATRAVFSFQCVPRSWFWERKAPRIQNAPVSTDERTDELFFLLQKLVKLEAMWTWYRN
jgi:hypothetical protein